MSSVTTVVTNPPGNKDGKSEDPFQPLKRMYDALLRIHGPRPPGVKRAKMEEIRVAVEFPEQKGSNPWDRLKNLKVTILLPHRLTVDVVGHATDIPKGSKRERLSLICKISDSTMRNHNFADPVGEDKVRAVQTRMHQFIRLREEDDCFVCLISGTLLERLLRSSR